MSRNELPGRASLALSLFGLALLVLLWLAIRYSALGLTPRTFRGAFLASVAAEAVAALCGFVARDTTAGTVGLLVSLVTLVLLLGFCCSLIGLLGFGGTGVHG